MQKMFFRSNLQSDSRSVLQKFWVSCKSFSFTRDKIYLLLLFGVIALSTGIKLIYVFHFTHYSNYLSTDMGGYWTRAWQLHNADIFGINQWAIWPPLFHIMLSNLFKVFTFIGLGSSQLENILTFNILLCSLSVYYLYRITLSTFKNHLGALLVATMYAFSFMMIYLKAFILSENMAIPLFIISIWYLFKGAKWQQVVSALLLAIATGIRPGYGLFGLPFVLYLFIQKEAIWLRVQKCFIFTLTFFLVVFAIMAHNTYISGGRMKGLSASSGLNNFFAFSKAYGVRSSFDGYYYVIYPPSTCDMPENGVLETKTPIYDTESFRKLTKAYIRENPSVLFKKVLDLRDLYFGNMMPWMNDARWFPELRVASQWYIYIMSVLSLLVLVQLKNKTIDRRRLLLLLSVPFFSFLVLYMYNTEHRYLYSFAFVIHLFFYSTLVDLFRDWIRYRKALIMVGSVLLLCSIVALSVGKKDKNRPCNIRAVIGSNIEPIDSINQPRNLINQVAADIDILEINREEPRLIYRALMDHNFVTNYFVDFQTKMRVNVPGQYEFIIEADDGYSLSINKQHLETKQNPAGCASNDPVRSLARVNLGKGEYLLEMTYFQRTENARFVCYCRYSNDPTGMQYYLGSDTKYFTFKK